jgi:hypothetical protein
VALAVAGVHLQAAPVSAAQVVDAVLVPDACEPVEGVRVAVQRNDAKEVAARRLEDMAVKPPAELDRP